MPQGGNFGAGSIPDTVIGTDFLFHGRTTTFKDYTCTKYRATATTATISYRTAAGGAAVNFVLAAVGDEMEFQFQPSQLTAADGKGVFLCYPCDCDDPMTGTTKMSDSGYGYILTGGTAAAIINPNTAFAPTIIGGGGLNA
tara:strand:+ start:77 stop:499 length:423 start_codon:yes stop_codon:yes gene_type:complete